MERTYNKTIEVIREMGNTDLYNTFVNVSSDKISNTYFMEKILYLLSDQSAKVLNDDLRYKLVLAIKTHFELVWIISYTGVGSLEKIVDNMYEDIYYINAYSGIRVATVSEVESGAIGLTAKRRWVLGERGEELYRQYSLMMWSITGKFRRYVKSGVDTEDITNRNMGDEFLNALVNSREVMGKLYDTLRKQGEHDRIVATINKYIRNGKFKYPDFAVDEVKTDISTKRILYKADKLIWKFKDDFGDSKKLLAKMKKYPDMKLTPLEVSKVREDFERANSVCYKGRLVENCNDLTGKQLEIKEKCDIIEKAVQDGLIAKGSWGDKISTTLKDKGYKFCSEKQMNILVNTINDIQKKQASENNEVDDADADITDDIYNILDALGKGELPKD